MVFIADAARLARFLLHGALIGLGVVAYYLGLAPLIIRMGGRAPRVVMYHACEETESDFLRGLGINTPPARLAAQLDFLRRHYRPISVEALARGPIPERAVAVTFDDGFRSVYENALPLLEARSFPALCYLVSDRLDDRSPIWINELNWYLRRHRAAVRALIAGRLGIPRLCSRATFIRSIIDRYEPGRIAGLLAEMRTTMGPTEDPGRPHLDRGEIEEMARRGFRFGNHTATHAVLSRLGSAACEEEIGRAREAIAALPGAIESLAYPFGRCGEDTPRVARKLGYTILMDVQGDNDPVNLDHVGRVNVTSDTPAVLFARLELVARIRPRLRRFLRRILPGRGR